MAYLTKATAEFDSLLSESERTIDLLQQRRTSLISAAVTGQIDLRNSVASPLGKQVSFANT